MNKRKFLQKIEAIIFGNDSNPFRKVTIQVIVRKENAKNAQQALEKKAMYWGNIITSKVEKQ